MALKGEKDSGLEKRSQLDKVTNEELVMHNGQVAFDLKTWGSEGALDRAQATNT